MMSVLRRFTAAVRRFQRTLMLVFAVLCNPSVSAVRFCSEVNYISLEATQSSPLPSPVVAQAAIPGYPTAP
jgi:hypothetical protein